MLYDTMKEISSSDRRYIVYCTALFTKCTTWRWPV